MNPLNGLKRQRTGEPGPGPRSSGLIKKGTCSLCPSPSLSMVLFRLVSPSVCGSLGMGRKYLNKASKLNLLAACQGHMGMETASIPPLASIQCCKLKNLGFYRLHFYCSPSLQLTPDCVSTCEQGLAYMNFYTDVLTLIELQSRGDATHQQSFQGGRGLSLCCMQHL